MLFIGGLIASRSVQQQEIAHHMDGEAKAQSNVRRIQRFLSSYCLSFEWLAWFILLLLPKKRFKLSMDRTNWDFGKVSFNLLVITLYWDGVGFPLYFEALDHKGNSDTEMRQKVLQRCIDRLGAQRIVAFHADREFIGEDWVKWLLEQRIPFFIRVRNNQWIAFNRTHRRKINRLMKGKQKLMLDGIHIFDAWLSLAIKRLDEKELVAVVTNTFAKDALVEYRNRWSIEVFFQSLKKRGFNLEDTHLEHPERLCKLFALASMAFTICFLRGKFEHRIKPIPRKNHGYKANSFFRKGLDAIREDARLVTDMNEFILWTFQLIQHNKERWERFLKIVV